MNRDLCGPWADPRVCRSPCSRPPPPSPVPRWAALSDPCAGWRLPRAPPWHPGPAHERHPPVCPNCGTQGKASDTFCGTCGALMPASRPAEPNAPEVEQPDGETGATAAPRDTTSWPAEDLAQGLVASRTCPRCQTRNPVTRTYCWRCLHELRLSDDASPVQQPLASSSITSTPRHPRRSHVRARGRPSSQGDPRPWSSRRWLPWSSSPCSVSSLPRC